MEDDRPNPDRLLEQVKTEKKEEEKAKKGKLKIFFGYAAGVGKTYAMLEAAHKAAERGIDVVAGIYRTTCPTGDHCAYGGAFSAAGS